MHAIALGDLLFTSGQIPLTLGGEMPAGIEAQTEQVFDNLAAVLEEAGTGLDAVVKATVFVTDLSDFAKLNAIYEKRFGAHKPARSTVQVAALPRAASVEIELIARLPPAVLNDAGPRARQPTLTATKSRKIPALPLAETDAAVRIMCSASARSTHTAPSGLTTTSLISSATSSGRSLRRSCSA